VVPSPFLEELASLKKAGLLNRGIEKASGIQFSMKLQDACSIPGLAKSIGQSGNFRGLQEVLSMNIKGMSGIRSGVDYLPREPAPIVTPSGKRDFRVTELELYINCPYDYYVSYVLGMVPLEEVTEDISPMDRGNKVHVILRDFYLSWNRAVTRESRDKARAFLRDLADASFDREADTFRNRREKEIFVSVMAERFLDAEEGFWKQGMRPAYLERTIERYPLVLPDGKEVELTGKIDRIDVDENGNFIIVDYKTGRYPLPKMNADQDIFQLPVYAVMAKQALANAAPALKTPVGLAYYDLAGKAGAGARDVVLYNNDALTDQPSSRPKASARGAGEFEAILEQGMDKARRAVEGILRGDFTSLPRDENRCRYCPNEMMCEKA
jgi:RecB family exonuclease